MNVKIKNRIDWFLFITGLLIFAALFCFDYFFMAGLVLIFASVSAYDLFLEKK